MSLKGQIRSSAGKRFLARLRYSYYWTLIGSHESRIGWHYQFDLSWAWKVRQRSSAEKLGFRATSQYSYYRTLIGSHGLCIGWHNQIDLRWPWKVRSKSSAEKHCFRARLRYSYYRTLTGRGSDGIISSTFGDLERSDRGHLLKSRGFVRDSVIVTMKH